MMFPILKKLGFLYQPYVLGVLSIVYIVAELGHFLIGSSSKATALDLHYGDISCQLNSSGFQTKDLPFQCEEAKNSTICLALEYKGINYCEWTYDGLGIDYQILAGPSFIAVYTVVGVLIGFAADRFHRVRLLAVCALVFSIAIFFMGSSKEYWHLVLLRMILAAGEAGCNPLSTGILSDIFDANQRGLVMSIFNWGIYGGYGIAFPVGRYVPELNLWDLGWRLCYYGAGIVGLFFTVLTIFTLKEPKRTEIVQVVKHSANGKEKKVTIWTICKDPKIILLCLAASIRHSGGLCFAYNCDLYFRKYFPDYDLGWWLFGVTIVVGGIGVVFGGIVSDKFVGKMGVRSRVAVLAISQLIATPFAVGSVAFEPVWALITLSISYFFAEMWFGILFAILVEVVPLSVRSTTVGVFLFVMNNIGGNLPIAVDPVSKYIGYREALYIFYAGAYGISSIMFLGTMFLMDPPTTDTKDATLNDTGHENNAFSMKDEHTNDSNSTHAIPNGTNQNTHASTTIEMSRL